MGVVVLLIVVAIAVVGVGTFLYAVFGDSASFRRERSEKGTRGRKDDDGGRGPRADTHAGATRWTGGGGFGTWGTWSGGDHHG